MSSRADPGRISGLAAAALAATTIVATASANGGYFPVVWGWTGCALALAASGALLLLQDVEAAGSTSPALGALGTLAHGDTLRPSPDAS